MSGVILTCNAGSTNTKLAAYDAVTLERKAHAMVYSAAEVEQWVSGFEHVVAIGHRVVHGGLAFTKPVVITDHVLKALNAFVPLAPLHQPAALQLIALTRTAYPDIPQIACFDTAFHHTMPEPARRLALPRQFHDEGIMRYGFHGLSYQHIADVLPQYAGESANGRVIVVHLGGGASACAMRNRQSVASTMGFSTLDGLMMGTRCGALDAGVVLHLLMEKHMTPQQVSYLLYHDSGLKGVSGISGDMQALLKNSDDAAKEAVALYCTLAAQHIAGLIPSIGGLDALVFTGGIGENAAPVRERITELLRWVGAFPVYMIPADEEIVMAQACKDIVKSYCN